MTTPNDEPNKQDSDPLDEAYIAVTAILERFGTATPDLSRMTATVPIGTTEMTHVPEGVMPTIGISRPMGPNAQDVGHKLLITYNVPGGFSRHITFPRNLSQKPESAGYHGPQSHDGILLPHEERALAEDLKKIAHEPENTNL